jgi:integrase
MIKNDNPIVVSKKRYRANNGEPRPYRDGDRWKAPAWITLPNGKREKVIGSGKTKKDAEQSRERLIQKRKSVINVANKDLSYVPAYCQHWLDVVKADSIRNKTRIGYQAALDHWISPYFVRIKVRDLAREDIQKIYAAMTKAGCSYSTVNQVRTVLNQALNEAKASGIIKMNPVDSVKMPRKKKALPVYITLEELTLIQEVAVKRGDWPKWALALHLGMRQGERLALRWSDIEINGAESAITINHSLSRVTGAGLVLAEPKSDSSKRRIPIPVEIADLLNAWRKKSLEARLKAGERWNDSDFVFTTDDGNPIDPANDRKEWMGLLKAAGVPYKKLHAARHTTATLMSGLGVDLVTVRDILGHSSISTTAAFYTHGQDEKLREAITKLANSS